MSHEKIELSVPPDVEEHGGAEILRLFICNGALTLSMQRAFEQPDMWGRLLAELAMQVAQVYAQETEMSAGEALAELRVALEAGLDRVSFEPPPIN
ncbi:protein of unknown function [Rhodoblastus acidophilus]|uniref:DUF5076 domain-containing protein n=1 Tax=Rhodoblastus acidophilus TaxID=1074 RepID=A0A212RIH6_RHOAC|nr:DUF5076 domain-containing protein [Rhodoblastus acidophilus]MCW2317024.1 hypothetical protein [Rhodoblastus acidophilus]PPQ38068.1 DUF5076 domain-containing protein [Rhodoblastus acidophilus]RAI18415.1 DUF5076 domain-containing protein [Rhodoblastus acidophilus]SNB72094.1 protein of unknown function [Rhodoblastus acidophilus]